MQIKLPDLKIPTLSEEISDWSTVWSLFDTLVHSRDHIQ